MISIVAEQSRTQMMLLSGCCVGAGSMHCVTVPACRVSPDIEFKALGRLCHCGLVQGHEIASNGLLLLT